MFGRKLTLFRLLGSVSLREAKEVPRERWADTRVGDILQRCTPANTIAPRVPALEAMARMNEKGEDIGASGRRPQERPGVETRHRPHGG